MPAKMHFKIIFKARFHCVETCVETIRGKQCWHSLVGTAPSNGTEFSILHLSPFGIHWGKGARLFGPAPFEIRFLLGRDPLTGAESFCSATSPLRIQSEDFAAQICFDWDGTPTSRRKSFLWPPFFWNPAVEWCLGSELSSQPFL